MRMAECVGTCNPAAVHVANGNYIKSLLEREECPPPRESFQSERLLAMNFTSPKTSNLCVETQSLLRPSDPVWPSAAVRRMPG